MTANAYIERVISTLEEKHPDQKEYLQAVHEVYEAIAPVLEAHPEYEKQAILERIATPERVISFRVTWQDDEGQVHVNNGYRVQHSSVNGPYKGGIRFDPTVTLSVMKFLAFEQTFKNSLTGLPMGGGKGGADFNPRGRSDAEIMRFCQAYMTELSKYISQDQDVPAGDIGVGHREIGYMYGQYKRLQGVQLGVLTGKPVSVGGSLARTEATGFGIVYFANQILKHNGTDISGKRVIISGTGNVGSFAADKATELGAKVIGISNITGSVIDEDGINMNTIRDIAANHAEDLSKYPETHPNATFAEGSIWAREVQYDVALPCATQNEISGEQAQQIVDNGVEFVIEGANMPSTAEAVQVFRDNDMIFGPAKAANAGGVGVSGLEMSQNSLRLRWTFEEVDERLHGIMEGIFQNIVDTLEEYDLGKDYATAANIYAFKNIAELVRIQGVI